MSSESRDVTRRQLLGFAATGLGLGASTVSAQQRQLELSEEEKERIRPLYLLLSSGATISIDASQYELQSLALLEGTGAAKGARLILRNARTKTVRELLLLAGPNVTIEL